MKLTPETVNKLKEAFAIDASVEEACFYAEITRQTYYNWVDENPVLKEEFDRLREKPVLKARQTIVKNLENPEYALKYLERKRKSEWALRYEHTGEQGKDLIPENIGGLDAHVVTVEASVIHKYEQGRPKETTDSTITDTLDRGKQDKE